MMVSYKKLWKILIDRDMTKQDLKRVSGVSTAAIAKLGKGDNVNVDTLVKICVALNVDTSDIMEIVKESTNHDT